MRTQRQVYGWHDTRSGEYRVSREPPDAPVRPSIGFETAEEAIETIRKQRRAEILWFPPLPVKKKPLRHAGQ